MPRVARQLVDGGIYHLINRGNGQQRVFHKDRDYQAFTDLLMEMSDRYTADVLAWCLMSNHYHLVVKPTRAEQLSQGMHWLQSTHVRRYHRHYGTSGHLWQGRYKSFVIDADEHLLALIRYVEVNPVRAKMVNSAVDWPWSSHREHCAGTGSEGARPPNNICPPNPDRQHGMLAPLPIDLPQPWTDYVDTPMTELEIFKMQNWNR